MMADLPRAFAEITCRIEDLHGIAVEGQRRDNAPDMHRALLFHLRSGVVALDSALSAMSATLDKRDR
jgi:hypothetical protein